MKLYFFSISFSFNYLICKISSLLFNKLEKNKILISYFPARPWHNQTLETVFQLIFHYTTKHQKIIHFPGIHFPKGNYFPANKRKKQTKRTIVHFSCEEREKKEKTQTIDHWWQSNYYPSTHATPCGRGNDWASKETVDDQIWTPSGVTRTTWMAQTPPTRWCVWNTRQQLFD
jgi:hypothetical protein